MFEHYVIHNETEACDYYDIRIPACMHDCIAARTVTHQARMLERGGEKLSLFNGVSKLYPVWCVMCSFGVRRSTHSASEASTTKKRARAADADVSSDDE